MYPRQWASLGASQDLLGGSSWPHCLVLLATYRKPELGLFQGGSGVAKILGWSTQSSCGLSALSSRNDEAQA